MYYMRHFLLLTLLLLTCVEGGRILAGDVNLDYANAGSMTKLSFSFMLTNPITSNNFILLALPFPFHSALIPAFPAMEGLSSPLGVLVTYQYMDNNNNILPTTYYCRVLTDTIDSSNYYIQFYALDRKTIIPIPANTWYYLTLQIQTATPLTYQTSNSVLQIQMQTVSSVWPNAIVYDDNLAFNYFQLAPTPAQLITVAVTPYNFGTAGGYLLTQQVYSLYLDVTLNLPTYYYNENLQLQFLVSQANTFAFNGTCSSVAKTNAPRIAMLVNTSYTCAVNTATNLMVVTLTPAALSTQKSFRFSVGMINPATIAQAVNLNVYAMQMNCPIILGYGTASGVLNTNQLYVTYQQIFLGWGLRPDALLPFDARIYRGNQASPTYMPYNSLSLKFSISQTTASFVELKVVISIPSEAAAFVLPSSYSFNLPAYPNKQVVCVTQYASSTTNRQIGCTGVGALTAGVVYYVGWKMFFPYDNYQSSVNCSKFGLLTVYTTTTIGSSSYAYYLGRGDSFLSYLKSSSQFVVIGRNSSYINYMTTFPSVNLVVLTSDFQEFLSQPESLYMNNRPPTYTNLTFNNFYVITQNLAFLTYINLFTDIYCAVLIPQNTDIVNGYGAIPLVATTTPKNTLTITTSNSQDWSDFATNTNPLVSSTATASTNTPGSSLLSASTYQSLIFSLNAAFASVSSFSSTPATAITNNWGIMIMMNPSITFDSNATVTIKESTASLLTPSVTTVTNASSYNLYTMITLRGSTSAALQTSFQVSKVKTSFGVYPFRVNPFSSIYSDSNNMDFMIATVDGIDGPLNKMTFNGYFLINGFTQSTSTNTIKMGFVNYQFPSAMDGSQVPTMLRIKGNIANNASALNSLVIFFDQLTPFFSNMQSGEIFCQNTDNTYPCRYYKGDNTLANGVNNYNSLSRFEISLMAPNTAFSILIPVTLVASSTNFYVAFQTTNATTSFKSLAYVQPKRTISMTYTASTSSTAGLTVTSYSVGQTVTNLAIKANAGVTVTANSGNSIGAAFSYFSKWNYFSAATISGFTTYGTCYSVSYLYYITNYAAYLLGSSFSSSYSLMTGIVCACDNSGAISSATLTASSVTLPAKWGLNLPGYASISQSDGSLRYINTQVNYQKIGTALTVSNITFPAVGPNMVRSVGSWVIPLPVGLDSSVLLTITGGATNLPFTFTTFTDALSTCSIYYNSVVQPITCTWVSSPTAISYTITILESALLPSGSGFSLVHYGMTSNSSYNNVTVSLQCYSLLNTLSPGANDLIFSASSVIFPYNGANYIGPSSLNLGSFAQWTQNKGVVQSFNFTFTLLSKGLFITNRIRFNLGQFALNIASLTTTLSPKCNVYTYDTIGSLNLNYDWAAIDVSGTFSALQLWPAYNILNNNLTYTVKCINFLSPSEPTPIAITAMVVHTSADLTGQISQSTSINLTALSVIGTNCQITLTKSFSIPSIGMDMNFNIISPGITTDSFLYLVFPSYYSNGLGPDIKCYSPSGEIYCYVADRFMTLQYLGTYATGTSFTITVVGVIMNINYNSGTFAFIFDTDNDPTLIQAAGTFADSISSTVLTIQNFPAINIFAFTQSSSYLRDNTVTITLTFYLDTSLTAVGLGQSLFMVFPATYTDILRFVSPTCNLNIYGNTLKNYVSTCTVSGMRIKMPFLDNLVLGSTYTLTVGGVINPTQSTSNVYRYSLEITDTTATSIVAKSYSVNCNYVMPTFTVNPVTIMLNYYLASGTAITSLSSVSNIQSTPIYISPSSNISSAIYARNTYLSPLTNLLSSPSNINLLAGSNPYAIRLSALTSGVIFLYFTKTGDGDYYSNLPPLMLTTSKNYFTAVSFVQTGFNLPINVINSQYNLIVTLPSILYPMSQVSFRVTLSNSSVGISLASNPAIISFYPGDVVATVVLVINDVTQWTVGKTNTLIFTPTSGTTAYASGTTLPLTAVAAASTPVTTFTLINSTLNTISFSAMCSQHGKFIYHLSRQFAYNLTACTLDQTATSYWLNQNSLSSLRVNEDYYQCNDIIGAVNVQASNSTVLTLTGLLSSTTYSLDGFCETQSGVQTNFSSLTQTTLSNGGAVSTMVFYFESALTTAQKIKLVCALALTYKIDYTKVSTFDGYYCSELLNRRLLAANNIAPRLLTTTSVPISVYFGINTDTTNDSSRAVIVASANTSSLVTTINTNVTGLPTLQSCSVNSLGYVGANDITGSFTLNTGSNYMYIYNLNLQNNGLVYVIVGDSTWSRAPVLSEIKTGSGPNGLPPQFFQVLDYKTTNSSSANLAWTSMPTTGIFSVYIVASDANPFDNANFGSIHSYTISPEVPSWEKYLFMGIAMLLVLIL